MNPELRKRFIDSIEYLRKMDFFKDYSSLSSEEVLDKMLSGEISCHVEWFLEERSKEGGHKHSPRWWFETPEGEEYYMKMSDAKIDLEMALFDRKRVFVEDPEALISEGICITLLKKLARVSRGAFNPTDIREEMLKWRDKPPLLGKTYFNAGWIFRVYFKFRRGEHLLEFYSDGKYLYLDPLVEGINELIKDTGYQYYRLHDLDNIVFAVFTKDEVEELTKRGWRLSLPKVSQG